MFSKFVYRDSDDDTNDYLCRMLIVWTYRLHCCYVSSMFMVTWIYPCVLCQHVIQVSEQIFNREIIVVTFTSIYSSIKRAITSDYLMSKILIFPRFYMAKGLNVYSIAQIYTQHIHVVTKSDFIALSELSAVIHSVVKYRRCKDYWLLSLGRFKVG